MKKILVIVVLLCAFSLIPENIIAAPADPTPQHIQLKDGRELTYRVIGDEFYRFVQTLDGYTLLFDSEQSQWKYAERNKEGELVPSMYPACNEDQRTAEENAFLMSISKGLSASLKSKKGADESSIERVFAPMRSNFPTVGNPKLLIILVEFSDNSFVYTKQNFQNMAMQQDYPGTVANSKKAGSIRDYFYDNSYSKLDLNIDVIGPYKLPNDTKYYGGNGYGSNDQRPGEMISKACSLAYAIDGIDFSQYDNDGDGIVDAVHVIYAGQSEAATGKTDLIWPHRSRLRTPESVGKVTVSDYSCSSELNGTTQNMDGIGVVCHEFGHILGLPDFYDTDYDGTGGTSFHYWNRSLMASGCYNNNANTPCFLTSLERDMLRWSTPKEIVKSGLYTMPIWGHDSTAYMISTPDSNEYFLLENRQNESWDSYISGVGMYISHVDRKLVDRWYKGYNDVNVNPKHQGYYIICADNKYEANEASFKGDTYPRDLRNTSFTDVSTPSAKMWYTTAPLEKPLTNIVLNKDKTVSFRFKYNRIEGDQTICDTAASHLPLLEGNSIDDVDSYQWISMVNSESWKLAPGVNDQASYQVVEIEGDSVSYRRIIKQGTVSDTSNTVVVVVRMTVGGNLIVDQEAPYIVRKAVSFRLDEYAGQILQWESKLENPHSLEEDWNVMNVKADTLSEVLHIAGRHNYRVLIQQGSCAPAYSNILTLDVMPDVEDETSPFMIYPNPSSAGIVYVQTTKNEIVDVFVYDIMGREILNRKGFNPSYETLNLSFLRNGNYVLFFRNSELNIIINRKLTIKK